MKKPAVRFGGMPTSSGYRFELTGGNLALDLANTVDKRPAPDARELLTDWSRLIDWSEQTGVVALATARRLRREGARRPEEALAVLRRVRFIRESLHSLFRSVAAGSGLPASDLTVLNDALPIALQRLRVQPTGGGAAAWAWAHPEDALDGMLPPIVRAAADLLVDAARLSRVRACEAADTCGWLFLDLSRNRSRRWCDMTVCGNRAKARRHYARATNRKARRRRPRAR